MLEKHCLLIQQLLLMIPLKIKTSTQHPTAEAFKLVYLNRVCALCYYTLTEVTTIQAGIVVGQRDSSS